MRRLQLVNNEIYHIVIRGVSGQRVFEDRNDYFRMIFSLYEFNTVKPVEIREARQKRIRKAVFRGELRLKNNKDPLVEILAFCLMPNHIHLLLRQLKEKGISQFMRKVQVGYAGYFNRRHKRMGYLFQGRFQAVHIKSDAQLKVIFTYIHTNPVSLIEPTWKTKRIKNILKVIRVIEDYKWSSYKDYIGKRNFPSLTKRYFLTGVMNGPAGCREAVNDWIKHRKLITKEGEDIFLED